jgi:hypothetical protein
LAIGGGLILFLYIWKKTTSQIDPFFMNWKRTKELCKINKRWSIKDVYRVSSMTGMTWMGMYEGDCILEDGTINVLWSNWKWGKLGKIIRWVFFPLRPLLNLVLKEYSILKAPHGEREIISVKELDVEQEKGKPPKKDYEFKYGDKIIDYVIFDNNGNCLVKAVSLSRTKNFFSPVVENTKGGVIDTRKEIFLKESSDALIGGLYNLTIDFANIMRERISIEPKVRYVQKTEGTEVRDDG